MGGIFVYQGMTELENNRYKLSPYNKCITNKEINRKEYTIAWYVDNCLASYIEQNI